MCAEGRGGLVDVFRGNGHSSVCGDRPGWKRLPKRLRTGVSSSPVGLRFGASVERSFVRRSFIL